MLAVFAVNNFLDIVGGNAAVGSLRQAIELANANNQRDTIIFQDYLFDDPGMHEIQLSGGMNGGPLELTSIRGVDIIGPGPGILTIIAGGNNRIFLIEDGDEQVNSRVSISGLTLSGGNPLGNNEGGRGGAILNREFLTLTEVDISNNIAPNGGGGIFNERGFVTIERSLIRNNISGRGGGGIQNGLGGQNENRPTTTILNSTITGNTAIGIPLNNGDLTGYGGGVLNLVGTVNIEQSTISGNNASIGGRGFQYASAGGGTATLGFDPMTDEETGIPSVFSGFATTNIRSSIIVGNENSFVDPMNPGEAKKDDVGSAGMTEPDTGRPDPFEPQINSLGYNLFGVLTHPGSSQNNTIRLPPNGIDDRAGVGLSSLFIGSELIDFGGVLPVFMPLSTGQNGMLAIDHGDPVPNRPPPGQLPGLPNENAQPRGVHDQRGFQFERVFNLTGIDDDRMDIGAAEVQPGNFVVNTLVDELDGRFSDVPTEVGAFPNNDVIFIPDFSLREALEFAEKNQRSFGSTSTVTFSINLNNPNLNPDPTPASSAPTILLTLGELLVDFPVSIQGPTSFELEIDATGNDPTPGVNNGDGSRVFNISDIIPHTVEISNLILRGGDQQEFGGAIFTFADLSLINVSIHDNYTTGKGGGIYFADSTVGSTLSVNSSAIYDNSSAGSGGGVFIASGIVTINNSTISGNTSSFDGGGIAKANGNLYIRYSTITLNSAASTRGSGVASYGVDDSYTRIRSSIISGNAFNDVQFLPGGTNDFDSQGYNLVGDGNAVISGVFSTPGSGDQPFITDPMLAPLTRLGGPTPVHRLLVGSPALNMGYEFAVSGEDGVPETDQRGSPFDRIEGGRIDIGSFEAQDGMLLVGNGGADEASFETFFEALEQSNVEPTDEMIFILSTWSGQIFPFDVISTELEFTDSVKVEADPGKSFSGVTLLIDDGDNSSLLKVTIDNLRFQNNTRIVSKENLTLTNMSFADNASFGNGGAISHENGMLTISDSTFTGNSTSGSGNSGGAIYVLNGDLEIHDSFLSGNSTGVLGGSGGAIYIRDGNFTADKLFVTGNSTPGATGKGGGIYGRGSTMRLTNATISGNSTTGSNSEGGGLAAKDSDITLIDPTIALNATHGSQSRGGGIFLDGGSLNIQNGNLVVNKTYGQFSSGGGISSVNANVTITGTSVDGNEVNGNSAHGGGIHAIGGDLTIRDSAVINNTASASGSKGGGIFSDTNIDVIDGQLDLNGDGLIETNGDDDGRLLDIDVDGTPLDIDVINGQLDLDGDGVIETNGDDDGTLLDIYLDGTLLDIDVINGQLDLDGDGLIETNGDDDGTLLSARTATILNSTVSGNTATLRGGGVYNAGGLMEIQYSTIPYNSVPYYGNGGGVASFGNSGTTRTEVRSSIIAGNISSFGRNTVKDGQLDLNGDGVIETNGEDDGTLLNIDVDGTPLDIDVINGQLDLDGDGVIETNGDDDGTVNTIDVINGKLDLDGSGTVDESDDGALNASDNPNSDVDFVGGNVTNSFVSLGYNVIGKGLALDAFKPTTTDFNNDGVVSGFDFLSWQRGFGTPNATKADGDSNGDMVVDSVDLDNWKSEYEGGDQIDVVDHGLLPLAKNDGPTLNHALKIGSPAIDAGDPSSVAGVGDVPEFDQRGTGFSRVINRRIDVGAFESLAPTDFDGDRVVSGLDFLAWQRGFGKPNATKADGDSNEDRVVDSVDLDNWKDLYGDPAPLSASQSGSEPLVGTVVAGEPLSLAVATETSLADDGSTTEMAASQSASASDSTSNSANAARGNVVFVMGLAQASPDLSPPETVVQEVETAAIDQSLAEYNPTSTSSGSTEESLDYGDIAVSRRARDDAAEPQDEFLAEDAVFAALGEGQ